MTAPDISLVIATWNQLARLRTCLATLFGNSKKYNCEVIIVDNGGSDGTQEFLSGLAGVSVLRSEVNVGVAAGRNMGIASARGRYLLMLDDDTLLHDGCLDTLAAFMDRHADVWLAGCRQMRLDGALEPSARTFYSLPVILARRTLWGRSTSGQESVRRHLMLDWDHDSSRTVEWVAGAAFCMRSEAIRKIGPFDEGYFFGLEDVDWAYRVWENGGRVAYVHNAVVTHCVQGSSRRVLSRRALNHLASLLRFYIKHRASSPKHLRDLEPSIVKYE